MRKGFKHSSKIISIGIIYLLFSFQTTAQTPHLPQNYPTGTLVNFVRLWETSAPEKDANNLMTRPLKDVKQATQYIDGLGRPIELVFKQGSIKSGALPTDFVTPIEYDEFDREQFKYLPYAESIVNDGKFKLNPFTQQLAFYNDPNGVLKNQGENYFYSQTSFETSPLNRITKTMAPGINWVGSNRSTEQKYWFNTLIDDVKMWDVTDIPGDFGGYSLSATNGGIYPANELDKTIFTDEHGKQIVEFRDKQGKVVLKKVQLTATIDVGTGSGYTNWICTYYIYDSKDNLRCIIQPAGVKAMSDANNWALTATQLAEQCFRYEYDGRSRLIMKKVPGVATESLVYDQRDRLVMTQDGKLLNQNKWMVILYDNLNRPIQTGLWNNTNNQAYHAAHADGSSVFYYPFNESTTPVGGWEKLTSTHYDNYNGLPASLSPNFDNTWSGNFMSPTNNVYPYPQAQTPLTNLLGLPTWSETKILNSTQFLTSVVFYDEKGRMIQTKSNNLTGGIDVSTIQYTWDGNAILMVQKQEKAGTNAQTTVIVSRMTYDDLGRLTKTEKKVSHTQVNNNAMPSFKTIVQNEYDALGQLKKKKLAPDFNGGAALETENYDYNIRGWMLGMNRDFVKDILPSATASTGNGYFGFDLGYDKANNGLINNETYSNPQYNGNIGGLVWKSIGDGEKRKFDFEYDAANRFLKADFTQYTDNKFNLNAGVNFSVTTGDGTLLPDGKIDPTRAYDANGNILQMQQWGLKINSSTKIDDLRYTYIPGTNRLKSITDFNNDAVTKLGDFKTNSTHPQNTAKLSLTPLSTQGQFDGISDYNYDVNGNLMLDNNKAITNIIYNHLNLAEEITVQAPSNWINGSRKITYTYDAIGNKLQKQVTESMGPNLNKTTTTTYIKGFVYDTKITNQGGVAEADDHTDVLQFISQDEGRIRFKSAAGASAATLEYDYMLKDHIGNIRMVLTEEQQVDQYPVATMEVAQATSEETFYSNLSSTRTDKPTTYPVDNTTSPNDKVAKVNGNGNKIGPSIILKVMAGDKFNIKVSSWYKTNGVAPGQPINPLPDLINALISGVSNASLAGGHNFTTSQLQNTGALTPGATQFLNSQPLDGSRPKAYLNWILLDEQFNFVSSSSGAEQVPAETVFGTAPNQTVYTLVKNDQPIYKNGYLFVYVSNETPNIDVFFDNLQIVHTRGPLLEETHYYPFGLAMSAISSKAAGKMENKKKYNSGAEFNNDLEISFYETQFRSFDPQIGRFLQTDPLAGATESVSPYVYANNNPITLNDPLGLVSDGPPETSTRKHPKTLDPVVMISKGKIKKIGPVNSQSNPGIPKGEIIDLTVEKLENINKNLEKGLSAERLVTSKKGYTYKTGIDDVEKGMLKGKIAGNKAVANTLRLVNFVFTVIDISMSMKSLVDGKGDFFADLPGVGALFSQADHDLYEPFEWDVIQNALSQGYEKYMYFCQNSNVGKRNPLVGVYVSESVMTTILTQGYLDLGANNYGGKTVSSNHPYDSKGVKYSYYLVFPRPKDAYTGHVSQMGILKIPQ